MSRHAIIMLILVSSDCSFVSTTPLLANDGDGSDAKAVPNATAVEASEPAQKDATTLVENTIDAVADYSPPKGLRLPMVTMPRLMISGGPSNPFPQSQMAYQMPLLTMFENATVQIMEDIKAGLRYIFQTRNEWTLALAGTGHVGSDALLDNIIEPGDVVLVPVFGMWGKRLADAAGRLGGVVKTIEKQYGSAFSLQEIEAAIKEHKPQVVIIIHGESSTGVHQQVQGTGDLCRKYNCILILDLVATMSIEPFFFDKWKIDAAYCNSQKGIGAPVGLAPITIGPRAVAKILARDSKPRSYRTDLKNWIATNYWNMDKSRPQILHHSYPVLSYYTLREALALIANEKLENIWARHENVTNRMYEGLKELQLEHYVPEPEDRLRGTILLNPPEGVSPHELQAYFRSTHGMDVGIGLGPTFGKTIRIGIMETNANLVMAERILNAFKDTLVYFKVVRNVTGEAPALPSSIASAPVVPGVLA